MDTIKLFPSDFSFLWENCQRCFWLQAKKEIRRPSIPLPSIFNSINNQMRQAFSNKSLSDINPDWPNGKIVGKDIWVKSNHIEFPEKDVKMFISGKLNTLIKLEDGNYGVIDFKTSDLLPYLSTMLRQLHAYAYAFNNPLRDNDDYEGKVTKLGIVIYDPTKGFDINNLDETILKGSLMYKELPYLPAKFESYLKKVANLLSEDEEPDYNLECEWCKRDYAIRGESESDESNA